MGISFATYGTLPSRSTFLQKVCVNSKCFISVLLLPLKGSQFHFFFLFFFFFFPVKGIEPRDSLSLSYIPKPPFFFFLLRQALLKVAEAGGPQVCATMPGF